MNILVTRPNEAGIELMNLLRQHNISAQYYSPIEIIQGRELDLLPQYLLSLEPSDYVFFVSKNAAYFAHQALSKNKNNWRNDLHYFAIGQATGRYFSEISKLAVRYPIKFANSEYLLQMPEMQEKNIKGKNILILRAENGRELISHTLAQRGGNIEILETYRRVRKNDINIKMFFFKALRIDTLIITSCDILNTLFENTSQQDKSWLKQCLLIVVSDRIETLAVKLGWKKSNIIISPNLDNNSLLDTVIKNQHQ